jgi:hypothetical protein
MAKASAHFMRYSPTPEKDARDGVQQHEALPEEVRGSRKNLLHIGQRKLLMSEVEIPACPASPTCPACLASPTVWIWLRSLAVWQL